MQDAFGDRVERLGIVPNEPCADDDGNILQRSVGLAKARDFGSVDPGTPKIEQDDRGLQLFGELENRRPVLGHDDAMIGILEVTGEEELIHPRVSAQQDVGRNKLLEPGHGVGRIVHGRRAAVRGGNAGKKNPERAAAAGPALDGNRAAHVLDEALRDAQPQPGAPILARALSRSLGEGLKDSIHLLRRDANAGIGNFEG